MTVNYQTIVQLFYANFAIIILIDFLIFFEKIFIDKFNLIDRVSFKVDFRFSFRRIIYLMLNQSVNLLNHYFIIRV